MSVVYKKRNQFTRNKQLKGKVKALKALKILASIKDPVRQIDAEQFLINLKQAQENKEFSLSLWYLSQARLKQVINDLVKTDKATLEINQDGDAIITLVSTPSTTPNKSHKPHRNSELNLLPAICRVFKLEAVRLGLGKEASMLISKILNASEERK